MQRLHDLGDLLRRLDGRGYRSYKQIAGTYDAGVFHLVIDHVQGDPFAEASRVRALVPAANAELPAWSRSSDARITATADFLNRRLHDALAALSSRSGSGKSGELSVLEPGQQVLARSSLSVTEDGDIEARFRAGLPADGRTILGRAAADLLTHAVPAAVEKALLFRAIDADALRRHVETVEDARALRSQLATHDLVAFVADGAHLPRHSGIDDRPLDLEHAVPFSAPPSLRVTLHTPNSGNITGLGVRRGVTLIVGGGFHGKSTLLHALERGVYDHIPGDGRERVVTDPAAVKVRAEDGRSVAGTDISNFIGRIPGGTDTRSFATTNASGSTSQAAAIIEAVEVGARVLLLDEDTSATNFMIRDARMQALIADDDEPITPLVDRARQLVDECSLSLICVIGGSGDYLDVADTVISMREFAPHDVTDNARTVMHQLPSQRRPAREPWHSPAARIPLPHSLDPARGHRPVEVKTRTEQRVMFGEQEVELSAVEQLVEPAQARAIALAIAHARGNEIDGDTTLTAALNAIMHSLERRGLDAFQLHPTGDLAAFRIFELAAFLNRVRGLAVRGA
jgi:predicted ABC-class ATPase